MAVSGRITLSGIRQFLKKFSTFFYVHGHMVKLITEKQILDWFRRSAKRPEDPPAENINPTLQQAHGVWKTEEAEIYNFSTS